MSLFKIISSDSLLNIVMFCKNVYANSLVFEALRYDINLAFFINQFIIIRIKLYETFIDDFFDEDNLIIKFITTDAYN